MGYSLLSDINGNTLLTKDMKLTPSAEKQLEIKNNKMEIDLHNIRHKDVQTKLDKFLGEHMMKGTNEVRIVTDNSSNMKKVVGDVLNDYGLTSQSSPLNNGILIIKL